MKPNKYMGNGKRYPDGTVAGHWKMVKGEWRLIDFGSGPKDQIILPKGTPSMSKALYKGFIGLLPLFSMVALVILMAWALTGCQVNVVNVVHSDIGVDAASQVVNEGGRL